MGRGGGGGWGGGGGEWCRVVAGAGVRPRGSWGAACGTKYSVHSYCMCCEYDYKFVHCNAKRVLQYSRVRRWSAI
eukprot:721212-Prymnesium_polylepis.1